MFFLIENKISEDQQRGTPNFPFGPDGSEDRIAKILNEANKAMNSNSNKDMPGTPPSSSAPNPLSFSSQVAKTNGYSWFEKS